MLISQNVSDFAWHTHHDLFLYISGQSLHICYAPVSHLIDPALAALATTSHHLLPGQSRLSNACSGLIRVLSLKSDLSSHFALSAPAVSLLRLLGAASSSPDNIHKALKICRFNENKLPWTILATHALATGDLLTAEVGLAALDLLDKVRLIQRIGGAEKSFQAELDSCLLLNKHEKAAQVLRSSSSEFGVVQHFTRDFRFAEAWTKAQEVAGRDASLAWMRDYVLYKRKRYIAETCGGKEFDEFFRKLTPGQSEESVKMSKKAFLSK